VASLTKEVTAPSRKVRIKAVEERLEIRHSHFGGRKRQAKVRLGEGRDSTAKVVHHLGGQRGREIRGDESTLVKVNVEARERGESFKDVLQPDELLEVTLDDNECIISVL